MSGGASSASSVCDGLLSASSSASSVGGGLLSSDGGGSPDLLCEGAGELEEERGEREWLVGKDCGQWIGRRAALMEQGRVLAVNVCFNLKALPRRLVTAACQASSVKASSEPASFKFAAHLLGLSASFLRRVFTESQGTGNRWTPRPKGTPVTLLKEEEPTGTAAAPEPNVAERPFMNLVRLALANATEGRSWRSYVRDVVRYQLAGAQVPNAYMTRDFCLEAVGLGALCLLECDAIDFNTVLPGLGIPSDFSLVADPVAVAPGMFTRHGELLVTCVGLVSARLGTVYQPLHSAYALGIGGHTGAALADAMLAALFQHPAAWDTQQVRARLACVGGDGVLTVGGPEARHNSPGAAELLWRKMHPAAAATCTTWDPFHRIDIALWRSIRGHEGVLGVFDLAKEVEHLFGVSEGALIFQAVTCASGTGVGRTPVLRAPGGTRKAAYISGVPGSLLNHFPMLIQSLFARIAWRQAGHSTQSITSLLALGGRLAAPRNIMLMLLLDGLFSGLFRPFTLSVQKHSEPCAFVSSVEQFLQGVEAAGQTLLRLQRVLRVAALCRQHLAPAEVGRSTLLSPTGEAPHHPTQGVPSGCCEAPGIGLGGCVVLVPGGGH